MWYSTNKMKKQVESFKARTHNLSEEERKKQFDEESEAGWNKIQECVLAFKAGPNILTGGRFDTLSLGTWMEIVMAVDIDYIPAQIVALPDTIEVFKSDFAPVKLDIPEDLLKYRGIVRLDSCGSAKLKAKMGLRGNHDSEEHIHGAIQKEDGFYFDWDDRTVHALMEYVGQIERDGNTKQPIWWRPWVKALQIDVPRPKFMGRDIDKWPLEWRVIVQNGKLAAISAYYIQAPVTLNDQVNEHLKSIINQTNKLLEFMKEKNIQPWHPRYIDELEEDNISFVCDFISTEAGPAFLEAGPAVPINTNNVPVKVWGAHPCFFMDKKVEGIALSDYDLYPLKDFV